jgi:hypothetical protein
VFWVEVRTLGEGGMGADVPLSLERGDTVLVDLVLPERTLSLVSVVRYQTGARHGFEFIDITAEQRSTIRSYCRRMAFSSLL